MIWIVGLCLAGLAVLIVLWPLSRRTHLDPGQGLDSRFYLSQVAAIDADFSSGLISEQDARIAKTDAARRALADSAAHALEKNHSSPVLRRSVALGALVFIPALTFGLYTVLGTPDAPDEPLAPRLAAERAKPDINALLQKLEAHLAQDPNDGRAFALVAPVYLRMDRTADAVHAFGRALALLGESADGRADYAEALIADAHGTVTPQAVDSLKKALAIDPKHTKAEYYAGLAAAQAGDTQKAIDIWQALEKQAVPGDSWLPMVQDKVARLRLAQARQNNTPAGAAAAGGLVPTPDAAAAASVTAMGADQRMKFIHTMVDDLAAKLAQNGNDPEGWQRLLRALVVLKDTPRAQKALGDARASLAANPDGLGKVNALATQLGLSTP
ncbi:MAG: c-type cytochrome biogenesis protein CcmI [Hyphomicrobiales bacterium]|nr:c-type cytochrome biogenesis protein CcmI [Hyphomicrobiales bacterium]MDE2113789.1 c-type cytochrome biogenesis protein CcmI [Hyphomicrobiales bacterium]